MAVTHGTYSGYTTGACRCEPCTVAANRYQIRYEIRKMNGPLIVPTDNAQKHIHRLRAQGMNYSDMSRACGLTKTQVRDIALNRRHVRGIRPETERRILAMQFQSQWINVTGIARRIQALAAIGHRYADIAAEAGLSQRALSHIVRHDVARVWHVHAARIIDIYDRWCMTYGPSDKGRRRAALKGWAPPLAWDDDTIDDPHATPVGVHDEDRTEHLDLDEWFRLVRYGEHPERAAERCGVKLGSVEWNARRHNRSEEYVTAMERSRERYAA